MKIVEVSYFFETLTTDCPSSTSTYEYFEPCTTRSLVQEGTGLETNVEGTVRSLHSST